MNKARGRASAVPFTPVDSDTEVLWVSDEKYQQQYICTRGG